MAEVIFHHAVAIGLSDGSWALLDPYCGTIGTFTEHWEIQGLYDTLQVYRPTLPGLAVLGHNGEELGYFERNSDKYYEYLSTGIALSKMLQAYLNNRQNSFEALISSLKDLPNAWKRLVTLQPGVFRLTPLDLLLTCMFDNEIVEVSQQKSVSLLRRMWCNETWKQQKLNHLFSRYHSWTMKHYHTNAQVGDQVPPSLEFYADTYHNLALFALNGLHCANGLGKSLDYRFLKHTSSQLIWSETVNCEHYRTGELDYLVWERRSEDTISALMFYHRTVYRKYELIGRLYPQEKGEEDGLN